MQNPLASLLPIDQDIKMMMWLVTIRTILKMLLIKIQTKTKKKMRLSPRQTRVKIKLLKKKEGRENTKHHWKRKRD